MQNFKVGFSTLGCPTYSVEEVVALARQNNFDGVEIRFIRNVVDLTTLEEFSPQRIAQTKKVFDDAGIEVNCIDTSVRFSSADPDERAAQRELAKVNCEIANGLGAPYIRVFGGSRPADADPQSFLDGIAEGLSVVAEDSWSSGVEALIETHDDFCTAATMQPLLDRSSDRLAVVWDSLHSFRHGESPADTFAALGPRIRQVHVKDASQASPQGFDLTLTGTGIMPIGEVVQVLMDAEFTGYVDFEWEKAWHPEIEDPEVAIPHFRTELSKIISELV
jgi:sugar phosphate isomerase/epimerase